MNIAQHSSFVQRDFGGTQNILLGSEVSMYNQCWPSITFANLERQNSMNKLTARLCHFETFPHFPTMTVYLHKIELNSVAASSMLTYVRR